MKQWVVESVQCHANFFDVSRLRIRISEQSLNYVLIIAEFSHLVVNDARIVEDL